MSQETINVGASANDGTGDTLRLSQQKANANFTELYGLAGGTQDLQSVLDNGNTSSTGLIITGSGDEEIRLESASIYVKNDDSSLQIGISPDFFEFTKNGFNSVLELASDVDSAVSYELPKKPTGTYTIAMVEDLPEISDDFINDAAAASGGIAIGGLYHTAGVVKIRLT